MTARKPNPSRSGLTLLELVAVLAILAALAAIVVPLTGETVSETRTMSTQASMSEMRDAISRYWSDLGKLPSPSATDISNGRAAHPQIAYLFVIPTGEPTFNAAIRRGWNGPYLLNGTARYEEGGSFTTSFGVAGDPAVIDGWGQPIVIQSPDEDGDGILTDFELGYSRLISAGANGVIETPDGELMPNLADRGDDHVLFLRVADQGI